MFNCVREYLAERTRERFEVVVSETRRHVHCVAASILGDAALAEDVTQEVFLALLKNPHRFKPSRADFRTYVFGITRNLSRQR